MKNFGNFYNGIENFRVLKLWMYLARYSICTKRKWCIQGCKEKSKVLYYHLWEMSAGTEGARGLKEPEVKLPGPYTKRPGRIVSLLVLQTIILYFQVQSPSFGFHFKKERSHRPQPVPVCRWFDAFETFLKNISML